MNRFNGDLFGEDLLENAPIPTRFSAYCNPVALLGGALLQWVRGVAMNYFAHGVMFAIRTDAYEKMQRLDMTFFDNKETGEIMSILNNGAKSTGTDQSTWQVADRGSTTDVCAFPGEQRDISRLTG